MPRLSKIRLTGCKYDGLRKEHENNIFDLTKDGLPDHSLFTLKNGGGKGVMMQLIFQLLLPETKWGKNNGNQVISMFYDKKNRLHPFTFHVVLEWVLDTVPEKRLITGIGVKSVIKNTGGEDEDSAGISYILYTHEHDKDGYYTVENLPLYDKEKNKAVDLNYLEEFLNDNKRDFVRYSRSSGRRKDSDYFRYLESMGIYRSEWLTLKSINKSEGGISDYFSSASDNISVFNKIIIPAISENIRNYSSDDGNSLIEMFKSNLSITKDLPVLLKREGDFKELLLSIEPLIQNADSGARFLERKDRLINEGNDIFYILKDEESFVKGELDKWSKSYDKAIIEKDELNFKRDNLDYNRLRKELEEKETTAREYEDILIKKDGELRDLKNDLTLYQINKLLCRKKEIEGEIEGKNLEKDKMIEVLNLYDIESKLEDLQEELIKEWDNVRARWKNTQIDYMAYKNYLLSLIDEENIKKNRYIKKKEDLNKEILFFDLEKADLQRKKENLLSMDYDSMSLSFPERILEDLINSKKSGEDFEAKIFKKIEDLETSISSSRNEIGKYNYQLNERKKSCDELAKKIEEGVRKELELAKLISRILLKTYDGKALDDGFYTKSIGELEDLNKEKAKKLGDIQSLIWEKNIQRTLNTEDFFIPNKDIKDLKDLIKNLGIHVETGIEYLQAVEIDEKDKILRENPSFLYSLLVANEREWDLIKKNIGEDILLTNMVPIYIRAYMGKKVETPYELIGGRISHLVDFNNFKLWKTSFDYEYRNLEKTRDSIGEDMELINNTLFDIKLILNKGIAFNMGKDLKKIEKEIEDFEEIIGKNEESLNRLLQELDIEKDKKHKNENILINLDKHIILFEDYIRDFKRINEKQSVVDKVSKEIENLTKDILNSNENISDLKEREYEIDGEYRKWEFSREVLIKKLRRFIKDIEFSTNIDKEYKSFNLPKFDLMDTSLNIILSERESLDQDLNSRNSSLAVIENEIKNLYKNLEYQIEELNSIDNRWESYKDLGLNILEIEIRIKELIKLTDGLEKSIGLIKSSLDTLKGGLDIQKKDLIKTEKRIFKDHRKSVYILEVEDFYRVLNEIDLDLKSNRGFIELCRIELDKNNKLINKILINLSKISYRPELDFTRGRPNDILKEKLDNNIDLIVEDWQERLLRNEQEIKRTIDEGERFRQRFLKQIAEKIGEEKLKEKIISTIDGININNFRNNKDSFHSMRENFSMELINIRTDKEKAEDAMREWTNRASIYVIRMIETLKDMISSMNYINDNGYVFPLVKLKGIERLPKEESEVSYLLKEYFIESISKIIEKDENIDNLDNSFIESLMGDSVIFARSLQGRYPVLLVYKMTENNEFKYARPRDDHYATWEAINKGDGILTEGSGGQTLSVTTFVTMMIMSFKKKNIGNENPSTVLLLDNPFGKASGKHVLDPIFEIGHKLNFQLISFAAPEIIKVEISERFPIFWDLQIEEGKIVHGGRIIKI